MRITLPPCDVGCRDHSSKQRRAWVRLFSARYEARYPALLLEGGKL